MVHVGKGRKRTGLKIDDATSKKGAHSMLKMNEQARVSKDATEVLSLYAREQGSMKAKGVAAIAKRAASNDKRKTVKGRDVTLGIAGMQYC